MKARRYKLITIAAALAIFSISSIGQTGSCKQVPDSKTCVDATPCKNLGNVVACLANASLPAGAIATNDTCWKYEYKFACDAGTTVNTCSKYESNSKCALIASKCTDTTPESGSCNEYTNSYSCVTQEQVTEQKMTCSTGVFDSSLLATPTNANNTFSKAALAQEILRQASTYGNDGLNIFKGVTETCRKGYFGIKNCCKSNPGATTNSQMMGLVMSAGASVVKYAGQAAVDFASPYMFDAMFTGGEFTSGLASSFASSSSYVLTEFDGAPTGTNFSEGGPSLSAYGFTYQSGVAAQGSGFLGANTTLATFGEGSATTSITFNPYVFAAVIAIQIYQEWASCSKDEEILALHKGANLSTFVNEECTKKIPIIGTCLEWTSTYCSFNSVLARIINTQGKPQLGMNVSDCSGFSVAQISQLDFTKIDLSEFASTMANQATKNLPTNVKNNYTPLMQQTTSGTSQGGSSVVPSY